MVIYCTSPSSGSPVFLMFCFYFHFFPLVSPFIATISNTRYIINIIVVTVIKFLLPSNRFLSDNPISSAGIQLFPFSNQDLLM